MKLTSGHPGSTAATTRLRVQVAARRAGPAATTRLPGPPPTASHRGATRRSRDLPHALAATGADAPRRPRGDGGAPPRRACARRGQAVDLPRDDGLGRTGGRDAAGLRCRAGDRVGVRMSSGTADLYLGILGVIGAGAAYVPVDADDPDERAETIWPEATSAGCSATGCGSPRAGGRARGRCGGRPRRRRLDHLHLRLDRQAQGRRDQPRVGGGVRRRRGGCSSERATAAGRPGVGRAFGGLRRFVRGDVARLAVRRLPGARAAVAGESGRGAGPVAGGARGHGRCRRCRRWRRCGRPRRCRGCGCSSSAARPVRPSSSSGWPHPDARCGTPTAPPRRRSSHAERRWCPASPVRIGLPLAGWQLAVVDAAGKPVRRGESGELVIAGAGLGRYLDPAKDAEKYRPVPALGWQRAYHTGDLVRSDHAGLLFVGRADDQVKLGGRRIELGEIDTALLALPGVKAAAAAVKKTKAGGEILVGYLAVEGARPDLAAAPSCSPSRCPPRSCRCWRVVDGSRRGPRARSTARRCRGRRPGRTTPRARARARTCAGTAGWLAGLWHEVLAVPIEPRLRLLRPRRHEPGHGDPRVAAARALPDGRRRPTSTSGRSCERSPPTSTPALRAGAHPGNTDRWTCRRRGCAPRMHPARVLTSPRRSAACAGCSGSRSCTTS